MKNHNIICCAIELVPGESQGDIISCDESHSMMENTNATQHTTLTPPEQRQGHEAKFLFCAYKDSKPRNYLQGLK